MRPRKTVLIMIDQVTRDAFGQLLVAHYLRSKGVRVLFGNQATFVSMCERHRPDGILASWLPTGHIMEYISGLAGGKTRVALIDQEAAKIGKEPFRRSFATLDGIKARWGKTADRIFVWGPLQAQWLLELGVVRESQILITGSPKLDPYLASAGAARKKNPSVGFTLRYDTFTATPWRQMEIIHSFAFNTMHGTGYPLRAFHEDRLWHLAASARCAFLLMDAVSRATQARLVVRPGPWEEFRMYRFLEKKHARLKVDPWALQHEYIAGSSVLVDECSSLGVEGLVAGVPVVSTQKLIPRLEEHIGGGGLFSAPYLAYFWRPQTVEEAVDLVRKALDGFLPLVPTNEGLADYLRDLHAWPRERPAAFKIGDAILEMVDAAPRAPQPEPEGPLSLKKWVYRAVPGSAALQQWRIFLQMISSKERSHLLRYHYFGWSYPHGRAVEDLFGRLCDRYDQTPA